MRLVTIEAHGKPTTAVVVPDRGFVPLRTLDEGVPTAMRDLLATGLSTSMQARIQRAAEAQSDDSLHPFDTPLLAPYRDPGKILGIGLNYLDHADDLAETHPTDEPASFLKGQHTIVDPGQPIVLPPQSERVTAEAELGLVIGRECSWVEERDALDHVAAVCCVLDQTAEDILARNPRFLTRCKNFPTFFSFGPELVTLDEALGEAEDLSDLTVETVHNGEVRRGNRVANMAFSPEFLVSFHSKVMPLHPGDIISTGTPGAAPLSHGDEVTARVTNVGELRNPVIDRA